MLQLFGSVRSRHYVYCTFAFFLFFCFPCFPCFPCWLVPAGWCCKSCASRSALLLTCTAVVRKNMLPLPSSSSSSMALHPQERIKFVYTVIISHFPRNGRELQKNKERVTSEDSGNTEGQTRQWWEGSSGVRGGREEAR